MADRVTETLGRRAVQEPTPVQQTGPAKRDPRPTLSELPQAITGAILGKTTFGDALNKMRAQGLRQERLENLMSVDERRVALAEREFDFKRNKFVAEYMDDDATAFEDAFKLWGEGFSPQQKADLYLYAKDHPDNVTRRNVHSVLARGIKDLDLQPPPKESTAQGTIKTIQDDSSPTGWSHYNFKTKERTPGAPAPDKGKAEGAWKKVQDKSSETGWSYYNDKQRRTIPNAPAPSRTSVEVTPGGGIKMTTGASTAAQKEILAAQDGLWRIKEIENSFEPSFLRYQPRFEEWVVGQQEKAKGVPVLEWLTQQYGETDKQMAVDLAQWKGKSWTLLNEYIKNLSGAAVTEQERRRLLNALPDPGTGILDGDAPYEFWTKLQSLKKDVMMIIARRGWAEKNGIETPEPPISLPFMERKWKDKFIEIVETIPQTDQSGTTRTEEEIDDIAARRTWAYFGVEI